MASLITVRENRLQNAQEKENVLQAGKRLYQQYCTNCHGADLKGSGNFPALLELQSKFKEPELLTLLKSGRRMMPSFHHLDDLERQAISFYLLNKKEKPKPYTGVKKQIDTFEVMPYGITGYHKFLSTEGLPALRPPWGTLSAINLNSGQYVWKIPLGEDSALAARGIKNVGVENYGGPAVTAGGLLFIAATKDSKIRAFNKFNGKLLWEFNLPVPGFATPTVYSVNNKQFIVIACGGGKLGTKSGDFYIAFALPE